jgi:hypothetical protein
VRSPGRSGRHELDLSGQRAPTPPDRNPSSDPELLGALWLISHFGWIAEATIRRSLIISGAQEILATALAQRLRQLLNRGWVEHRHNDAGTDEPEWRLTDNGRAALAHRG